MSNTQMESLPSSSCNRIGTTLPRRLILIALLALGVYVLFPRLAGVPGILGLMRQARRGPLLLAVFSQLAGSLSLAYAIRAILLGLGPGAMFVNVLQVSLASGVASLFLPSLGLSGLAVRIRYLGESGYPAETVVAAYALETLGQGAVHTILMTWALAGQQLAGQAAPWRVLPILFGTFLLAAATLALALASPRSWLESLLMPWNNLRRRLGRSPTSALALEERLATLRQALITLPTPAKVGLLLGSLLRNLANVLCLHWTLLAYNQALPLQRCVINYTLSDFLGYLSTLPGGLVVTDTSLTALLAGAGVALSTAVPATLTFRLIVLWLPRLAGLLAWYNLQRRSPRPLW
ncbi:MAG: flippase-like domain-containing protein [Chloroflexi bacterium]|nr:flippase-like domain-containing protein [Chloroflexota bacterium]